MAKDKVGDWSTDQAQNTDVGGTPLLGSIMKPSELPVALRKMMAQLKAANDNYPTPAQVSRARFRSRAVNGAFQMAQENGNTVGTANGYRPADNWWLYVFGNGGAGSAGRVQVRSLNGSTDQLEFKTTTAKASLASNEFASLSTAIEGSNMADFEWGTAKAKAMLVDFEINAPAGTYCIHASNPAANRNYSAPYIIAANEAGQPVRKTVRIEGDTTGTWESGNAAAVVLDFVLASGPTLQAAPNAWGVPGTLGVAGQRNILDTVGNTVRIADVGIYAANDNGTTAPAWEPPSIEETERWCHRYYWKLAGGPFVNLCNGMYFNNASWTGVFTFPVTMRAAAQVAVSAQNAFEVAGTAILPTTAMGVQNPGTQTIRVQATVAGATAGQGGFLRFGSGGGWISFHARLLG